MLFFFFFQNRSIQLLEQMPRSGITGSSRKPNFIFFEKNYPFILNSSPLETLDQSCLYCSNSSCHLEEAAIQNKTGEKAATEPYDSEFRKRKVDE